MQSFFVKISVIFLGVLGFFATSNAQNSKYRFTIDNKYPIVFIDDIQIKDSLELGLVDQDEIASISVLKNVGEAKELYGKKAKDGAIVIVTKSGNFEEILRSYYYEQIMEKIDWVNTNRKKNARKISFVLNGESVINYELLKSIELSALKDLRMLTKKEWEIESGQKLKGLCYIIVTE